MRKIEISSSTVKGFIGILRKNIKDNQSMIFPSEGELKRTSKFGILRKNVSKEPHQLTTDKVQIILNERRKQIEIINPLNKGYGYGITEIPFGQIIFRNGLYFWKDKWGYWRCLAFSKSPGWALALSNGVKKPHKSL